MKKFLVLIITFFISYSLQAQCLGGDCSIKGRNQARKKKEQRMTGHRSGGGSLFSVSGSKKKRKRTSGQGYDPFASSGGKGKSGSQGFDPFADADKKKKKKKGGQGYDPFASNSKGRRKAKNSGGYDPFADSGSGKKGASGGGYDPFDNDGKSKKSKKGGGTWIAGNKKKKLKVNYSSPYNDWDSNSSRGPRGRRGRANDSWLSDAGGSGVSKGGGTWASNSNSRSGGKSYRHSSGSGGSDGSGGSEVAPPSYSREDNYPKSYSDFDGSSVSRDLVYDNPHQYKFSLLYGQIYKHDSKVKNYLDGADLRPVLGAEFAIEWPSVGDKNWHHYFNVPTPGLAFTYLNLGNENLLGSAFAIYPYVDIPLVRTDPFDLNFTAGFGIGCATKWNKQHLSDSIPASVSGADTTPVFGSPINVYMKTGLNMVWRPFMNISNQKMDDLSHYSFFLGAYLVHMSNGNFASPNSGLNMFLAEAGVKYCPTVLTPVIRKSGDYLPRWFTLDIMGSAFVREQDRYDDSKYLVGNFNVGLYYQLTNIYRLGVGLDAFYDESFAYNHYEHSSSYDNYYNTADLNKFENRIRGGACLSNEFILGRVTAALDGGYHVYDNIKPKYSGESDFISKTYFRLAMKYHFTTGLYGVVALKTHMFNAEYMTFGLGYSIVL